MNKFLSLFFMGVFAALVIMLWGVALYVGIILFAFAAVFMFFFAGAGKLKVWWHTYFPKAEWMFRCWFARLKSWFSSEKQEVHHVDAFDVEILEPDEVLKVLWKNDKGLPLEVVYDRGRKFKIWLFSVIHKTDGVIYFEAMDTKTNMKKSFPTTDMSKVILADGRVFDLEDFFKAFLI